MNPVPGQPSYSFTFVRPQRYYGIISNIPLPVIPNPVAVLHPVLQYPALLQELTQLDAMHGVNSTRLLPLRAFLHESVQRGTDALPDLELYLKYPGALQSSSLATVYLFNRARSQPQAWQPILKAVLHLFWMHAGRVLVGMGREQPLSREAIIPMMRTAVYPVQKLLHLLYEQRDTPHFLSVWEEAAELVLGALFSLILVHSTVQQDDNGKPDLASFFEDLSHPDGREGFLGVLYTAFWQYPRPRAAETFEIFPYVVPAEALAGPSVMRVQFDALEHMANSEFFGLTDEAPILPRLPRTHVFSFRPLNGFWRHVVHRCWRAGCPREYLLGKMRRCKACQRAFYCTKECQRLDWQSRHKPVCRLSQQLDGQGEYYFAVDTNSVDALFANVLATVNSALEHEDSGDDADSNVD
ncbi:hypothetical protein PENSPDRAFT_694104 [Peniophora sp. CONT]|nr:hypothetical protein PENSPDRAFT_694104 [Peniophora sp. CONT]